ncbi:hypothetical protein [Paenibacillus sp. NPDC101420]|uniref:hypothetical protein n=1 Tax=Paenibacillus sp. NPDC101420 TaxID=3390602 RepID=UPI003CFF26AC
MNRKQRIRVCGNLQQLIETAPSTKLRERYRKQYVSTASRINEKQPTGVGAGRLITNLQNSITISLSGSVGKSNVG